MHIMSGKSGPLRRAETAERIDVLFGVETRGDPRHTVFYGDPDFTTARGGSTRPSPNYFGQMFYIEQDYFVFT